MIDAWSGGGPMLQVRDLRVSFGSLVAVNDVSFDVSGGDLVGLIGPNGAGKTTLLRAMSCLQPARGSVSILGRELRRGATDLLRHLGFTPDTPALYEDLTVRKFLQFIARGYGMAGTEINERIDFWLEKTWLTEKADQKIRQLSRGMRQRVGIARTLLPNPAVVLLDEPAAGLDPAGRVQFRQLLCNLRAQGKAIVVSSHILADMDEYCTHIAIMSAGSIVQFGTVSAVTGHVDASRCRYALVLARPMAGLNELLGQLEGVSQVCIDTDRITLEFWADKHRAAALLAELVRLAVPVASFVPHRPDLEEAYLRAGIKQVD